MNSLATLLQYIVAALIPVLEPPILAPDHTVTLPLTPDRTPILTLEILISLDPTLHSFQILSRLPYLGVLLQ